MFSSPRNAAIIIALLMLSAAAGAQPQPKSQEPPRYGLGQTPTAAQIAGWDIDVRPDGHGVKKGRGTVDQGQVIYDAQCASCHGTFGESNRYLQIAGGVRKGDIEAGRASGLKAADGLRTLGSKLNHATTLWDYINRAMPWANPQSMTVDEVYAVTAYVLHLNDIVPADFELNEKTLLSVRMPNRDGFTMAHGLGSIKGKPDAQGSACMKDCVTKMTVASSLPEFARNQNGNLAQQMRTIGPWRGIDTARYDIGKPGAASASAAATPAAAKPAAPAAKDLLARNACTACHGLTNKLVGPGFNDIAAKYHGRSDAESYLARKIKDGSQGVWGAVPMPPQPGLKDDEANLIARWIAAGAN